MKIAYITGFGKKYGSGHLVRIKKIKKYLDNSGYTGNILIISKSKDIKDLDLEGYDLIIKDARDSNKTIEKKLINFPLITFDDYYKYKEKKYLYIFNAIPSLKKCGNITDIFYMITNYDGKKEYKEHKNDELSDYIIKNLKVLVTFGLYDPYKLLFKFAKFLNKISENNLLEIFKINSLKDIAFILPKRYLVNKRKFNMNNIFKYYTILPGIDNLSVILNKVDIVVTHFGLTLFEAISLNKKVLIINPTGYHNKLSNLYFKDINCGTINKIKINMILKGLKYYNDNDSMNDRIIDTKKEIIINKNNLNKDKRYISKKNNKNEKYIYKNNNYINNKKDKYGNRNCKNKKYENYNYNINKIKFKENSLGEKFVLTLVKNFNTKYKNKSDIICPICLGKKVENVQRFKNYNLYKCKNCKSLFKYSFIDDYELIEQKYRNRDYFIDEYKNQYGKTYIEDRDNIRSINIKRIEQINNLFLKKILNKKSLFDIKLSLLDIGSGYGFFLKDFEDFIKEKYLNYIENENNNENFKIEKVKIKKYKTEINNIEISKIEKNNYVELNLILEGVEFNEQGVEETLKMGFQVYNDDFLQVNFNKKYDIITSWFTLEHIENINAFLHKVKKLLNNNGIFAFSVPSLFGPTYRYNKKQYLKNRPEDHYFDFSKKALKIILQRHGFKLLSYRINNSHYERFKTNNKILSFIIGKKVYTFIANILKFSDTIEIYAKKN